PWGASYGSIFFSPDGRHLLSSWGFTIRDLLRGEDEDGWRLGNAVAVSPDKTRVAAVDSDGNVAFYRADWRGDVPKADLIVRRRAHQDRGRSVAFSPDGRL